MNILVLQHERIEHPGIFRQYLDADRYSWSAVHLNEGESLPSLDDFDALWVMGGPMDTWQEQQHPWLVAEKQFIREAVVSRGMPYLGLCLGHQLLAEALGGSVGPSSVPEIGIMDVHLTQEGRDSGLMQGVADVFPALQWHSAEVKNIPEGARCLAMSPDCDIQALSWGANAYSLQFHVEIEPDTVANWMNIAAYATALENVLGADGAQHMESAANDQMLSMNKLAARIYQNWMTSLVAA